MGVVGAMGLITFRGMAIIAIGATGTIITIVVIVTKQTRRL